jgi:mono/diheme cytochrome c family protein
MLRRSLWFAGVTLLTVGGALAQDKKSVWAGVYEAKQAARGAELYTRACAACHGQDLEGIEQAPSLAGGTFAQRWDGSALKKLFERMEEMPPDDPNKRLSDQQNVDLLAFLLSANKIPAGTVALDADRNGLAQITFLATKPKYDTGSRFPRGF